MPLLSPSPGLPTMVKKSSKLFFYPRWQNDLAPVLPSCGLLWLSLPAVPAGHEYVGRKWTWNLLAHAGETRAAPSSCRGPGGSSSLTVCAIIALFSEGSPDPLPPQVCLKDRGLCLKGRQCRAWMCILYAKLTCLYTLLQLLSALQSVSTSFPL